MITEGDLIANRIIGEIPELKGRIIEALGLLGRPTKLEDIPDLRFVDNEYTRDALISIGVHVKERNPGMGVRATFPLSREYEDTLFGRRTIGIEVHPMALGRVIEENLQTMVPERKDIFIKEQLIFWAGEMLWQSSNADLVDAVRDKLKLQLLGDN